MISFWFGVLKDGWLDDLGARDEEMDDLMTLVWFGFQGWVRIQNKLAFFC